MASPGMINSSLNCREVGALSWSPQPLGFPLLLRVSAYLWGRKEAASSDKGEGALCGYKNCASWGSDGAYSLRECVWKPTATQIPLQPETLVTSLSGYLCSHISKFYIGHRMCCPVCSKFWEGCQRGEGKAGHKVGSAWLKVEWWEKRDIGGWGS